MGWTPLSVVDTLFEQATFQAVILAENVVCVLLRLAKKPENYDLGNYINDGIPAK